MDQREYWQIESTNEFLKSLGEMKEKTMANPGAARLRRKLAGPFDSESCGMTSFRAVFSFLGVAKRDLQA